MPDSETEASGRKPGPGIREQKLAAWRTAMGQSQSSPVSYTPPPPGSLEARQTRDYSERILTAIRERNEYASPLWNNNTFQGYIDEVNGRLFDGIFAYQASHHGYKIVRPAMHWG